MIIATTTVNFAYLTGVWLETYERFKAAVKCGDRLAAVVPALDAGRVPGEVYSYRDGEDPAEALRQSAAGCDASVIYIDGGTALRHFKIVKRAFPGAEYRIGDHIFREWRMVKRRDEVEKIRAAASAIRRAMEELELAPGVSERQTAARIYLALYKAVYAAVEEAQRAALQSARPGTSAGEVDRAARSVIETRGYGPYFIHRTGHGLGLEIHEAPDVSPGSRDVLKPGAVFTIEPGVYLPGKFGVRLEIDVHITDQGAEVL